MQKSENSAKYGWFSLKNQHSMLKIGICEKSRKTQKLFARLSDLAHFRICWSLQSLEQKYLLNFWNFYFSAKNQRFSAKIGQNQIFWPKIRDFSLKNKNFKNLKDIFVFKGIRPYFSDLFNFSTVAKRSSSSSIRYIMCYILKSTVLDLFKQTWV